MKQDLLHAVKKRTNYNSATVLAKQFINELYGNHNQVINLVATCIQHSSTEASEDKKQPSVEISSTNIIKTMSNSEFKQRLDGLDAAVEKTFKHAVASSHLKRHLLPTFNSIRRGLQEMP